MWRRARRGRRPQTRTPRSSTRSPIVRTACGVSFGNFLIKQVVEELQAEFPQLKLFSTLSPVPSFRHWLTQLLAEQSNPNAALLPKFGVRRLVARSRAKRTVARGFDAALRDLPDAAAFTRKSHRPGSGFSSRQWRP